MTARHPNDAITQSVPAPPAVPRESLSDRELLLELHARLDVAVTEMRAVGHELERLAETLAEHDRAWFLAMNFLAEQAKDAGQKRRERRIRRAIEARQKNGAAPPSDEPTDPGAD